MDIKSIKREILREGYNIGFFDVKLLEETDKKRYKKIHWLDKNSYKLGWFADPFFLGMDEHQIYILAEEFVYAENKGRLVKLTISKKNYKLLAVDVILELDTHLSFPITIAESGSLYIYPENYQSGSVSIYLYDKIASKLVFVKQIINEPLLDTQIIKIDDTYYAFGVKWVTNSQDDTKKLMIFESSSLFGPYKHIQTIQNAKKEERGAGLFFTNATTLYRPAQSCENGYGKSVIIYKMDKVDGKFVETEIKRYLPDENKQFGMKLHTLNTLDGICVIDGYGYNHPFMVKFIRLIKKIKKIIA